MARMPVQVAGIQSAAISGARFQTSPERVDAGEGVRAAGQAIAQAADVQGQINDLYDSAAIKELDNDYAAYENEVLRTGESAYLNEQGKNALDLREKTETLLSDRRTTLLDSAKTSRQRELLTEVFNDRKLASDNAIARHAGAQTVKYEQQQSLSRISLTQERGRSLWMQPKQMETERQTGRSELLAMAQREGWGGEVLDLAYLEYDTKFYSGIVSDLADRSPMQAKAFLDRHGDSISEAERSKLEDMLEAPLTDEWAEATANSIRGVLPGMPENSARENNLSAQLARVDAMGLSKDREDALKSSLRQKAALDKQLLSDRETAAQRRADEAIEQLGSDFTALSQIPPQVRYGMSAKQRIAYSRLAKQNREGASIETDWEIYSDISSLPEDQLAKVNPYEYRSVMADTEFKQLVGWVRGAREGDAAARADRTNVQTWNSKVNDAVVASGIDKKNKKQAEKAIQFRSATQNALLAFEEREGRAATPQEQDKIIATQMMEIHRGGGLMSLKEDLPLWRIDQKKIKAVQVPEQYRPMIIEALEGAGFEASEENIRARYLDVLEQNNGKIPG